MTVAVAKSDGGKAGTNRTYGTYEGKRASFAYFFERFPSFTQTFCFREVEEMVRQGMEPAIYSIREAEGG